MEKPNILLITVDSLRFDHLGCYGYSRNTSPNIDSLASKGAVFLEAISNGGQTTSAFPPIMASVPSPIEESECKAVLQRNATLAEVLKSAGYQTAAFHSNPMISRFHGYGKGFDVFDDSLRQFSLRGVGHWIRARAKSRDSLIIKALRKARLILMPILTRVSLRHVMSTEEMTNKSISWLEAHKEKFFLWLHYMEVHWPYTPASKYLSQICDQPVSRQGMNILFQKMLRKPGELSRPEIEMLINLYDAGIKYTDEIIGFLLDKLRNYLTNTIVIVTADHGEAFGEHNVLGHDALYEELVHVPLIMVGPGIKAATVVKEPIELMDLAPTIADLVGINSIKDFRGRSLLPVMRGGQRKVKGIISTVIISSFGQKRSSSYRTPEWKYIRTESLDGTDTLLSEEVYDLNNDPQERHNLHGAESEEARAFELGAVNKILEFRRLKSEEKTAYEKERIRARLRKLPKL